jgi:hypothetical protein
MSEERLRHPQSRSSCANAFASLAAPGSERASHGLFTLVPRSSANLLRSGVQLKSCDRVPLFLCTARSSSAEDNARTPATKATVALPKKALKRCVWAAS